LIRTAPPALRGLALLLALSPMPCPARTPPEPAAPSPPAAASSPDAYRDVEALLSPESAVRRAAAGRLIARRDPRLVPPLTHALFFAPPARRDELLAALSALAGERPGCRYRDWVELVLRRRDLAAPPGYLGWKGALFARIDPRYASILAPSAPLRLRLEEVVSGGVGVEGIPALERPPSVPAAAAGYLEDSERVFGASVGGARRAYPLRILAWHEMANDVLGGQPVTLSYCTLCGSALLFSGRTAAGDLTFGTSGLLYRSNKLMLDRKTGTLWSNLAGEAVLGPLAAPSGGAAPCRLEILPLTATTWGEWRARHPDTTVLALEPERGARWGFDYRPGAAERRRAGVRFPAPPLPPKAAGLAARDPVYAVRLADGRAKAFAVAAVLAARVVDDRVGEEPVVLVGDPASGALRAYARGAHAFRTGPGGELLDEEGRRWSVGEESLATAEGAGPPLPRLPGHLADWFAWSAFFPDAELYGGRG